METHEILNLETGTKESTALKPATVKIVNITIEEVGEKKNQKVVFSVKHPDKEELINISSVKYEFKGSLKVTGTWVNLDEDKKLRKGSALANLISFSGVSKLEELKDKDIGTAEDEKGYLCLKAY